MTDIQTAPSLGGGNYYYILLSNYLWFGFVNRWLLKPVTQQRWRLFARWKQCSSSSLRSSAAGAHTSSCCYTTTLTVSRCPFTCTRPCWRTCMLVSISQFTASWIVICVPVLRHNSWLAVIAESHRPALLLLLLRQSMAAAAPSRRAGGQQHAREESKSTDRLSKSNITNYRKPVAVTAGETC